MLFGETKRKQTKWRRTGDMSLGQSQFVEPTWRRKVIVGEERVIQVHQPNKAATIQGLWISLELRTENGRFWFQGSHNDSSQSLLTPIEVNRNGIDPNSDRVVFSHCTVWVINISFKLANAGFEWWNSALWREKVSLNLTRRAAENSKYCSQVVREFGVDQAGKWKGESSRQFE